MGYESALQRVGELRALTGGLDGASTTSAAAGSSAAFQAQLAQQQALLSMGADDYQADPSATDPLAQMGVPVLTVADQYRMMGGTGTFPGLAGMPGVGGIGGVGSPTGFGSGAVGQRMVQLAQQELGVSETGGNNDGSRIREYRGATAGAQDTPGPWCAYFVSWLAKGAGAPIGAGGNGTGYVPTLEAWGRQTGRYQDFDAARAQPGDIAIFDWGGDGVADHTGIVERVDPDGTVHTIEGNSSDRVQRRTYASSTNDIKGFVRPG